MPSGSVLDLGVSCGLRNSQQKNLKIIGGKAAKKGHWPWQVCKESIASENFFRYSPPQKLVAGRHPSVRAQPICMWNNFLLWQPQREKAERKKVSQSH